MEQIEFERCIVVRNPASTNSQRCRRWVSELRQAFPKAQITEVTTLPGGRAANQKLLQAHARQLGPRTLLAIAAGDGTVNMVVEMLFDGGRFSAKALKTPILPLWCGNANDLAHMLCG